jgi:hemolysin activation/secretion protein
MEAESATEAPGQADGKGAFVLLGVKIYGATVFQADELSGTYEDKLTKPVTTADIVEVAGRITRKYRDEGYFLSQAVVASESPELGLASIRVIEGRISQVSFSGERSDLAAPMMMGLEDEPIARLADIDRRLSRINDIPGMSVTSRVVPDADDPARHELVLETKFEQGSGYAGINNRGADTAGPIQGFAGYAWNSLLAPRDQVLVSLFTTPENPREFTQLSALYRYGFKDGSSLRFGAAASLSQDGFNPQTPETGGESTSLWMRYEDPLVRQNSYGLWASLGFDSQHFENDWASGGGYRDELRVARVALRGFQTEDDYKTYVFVEVSSGLDILGASEEAGAGRSRFDADAEFTKVYFDTSLYHDIGKYFGVYTELSGQWTDGPLLLSEEYSVGGPSLGRAYRFGEISGDKGLGALLELRAGYSPDSDLITFAQSYIFYDAASVWNKTPIGWDKQDLSSAGLGVRFDLMDRVSAGWEFAKPLTRTPYDETDRDWRQFFQLSVSY